MKKIFIKSLLLIPFILSADVIPAINSNGGGLVLPEGKLKMGIKHINFERTSMFDGTNEVQNREKLDATANMSSANQKCTNMQCKSAPLRNTYLAEISNSPAS
ncbi:MAG: hypothetical protein C0628_02050, partial [Sulfurimonas sp.]